MKIVNLHGNYCMKEAATIYSIENFVICTVQQNVSGWPNQGRT